MRFGSLFSVLILAFIASAVIVSCDSVNTPDNTPSTATDSLTQSEVKTIVAHAVEEAKRLGQKVDIAVVDREGNNLAAYSMGGTVSFGSCITLPTTEYAREKALTAAYLSSNGHAFTSLTASFITRNHFPPGIQNTPAGPLFGVGFSSLPGGDIQPNAGPLNDRPGGVPIYKNEVLVGGVGVSGPLSGDFDELTSAGSSPDESIALAAAIGFSVPDDRRGDRIFIDGVRFLYSNVPTPAGDFTAGFDETSSGSYSFGPVRGRAPKFPASEGYVSNLAPGIDFSLKGGTRLSAAEVDRIIHQAAAQAARTRAAIRRPLGKSAQVFIAVVDLDGSVLGIWRTPDATIFSFDVSAQKARTALAFSDPNNVMFGKRIRSILNIPSTEPLAITTRAIGFLSQSYFPPGIDRDSLDQPVKPGPLYEDGPPFQYQCRLFSDLSLRVGGRMPAYGNGITIFPGGIPLYRDGELVGAIGVSGDGVDQDDLICSTGTTGFEPPDGIRCDQDKFRFDGVRLPFIKVPRRGEL